MSEDYEPYSTACSPCLDAFGALRAVAAYASDFIARGDIDVMFTVSGGAMGEDGRSADPAIWMDWVRAWREIAPDGDAPAGARSTGESRAIDMQHGYRAFHLFLKGYQPSDQTPMSAVLRDCDAVADGTPEGASAWPRWLSAVAGGESADIAFRLTRG